MKNLTWREKLLKMAQIDVLYMINNNAEKFDDDDVLSYPCCRELITGNRQDCPNVQETGIKTCKECLERLLGEEV